MNQTDIDFWKELRARWARFASSHSGRVVLRILRYAFIGSIVVYLAVELTRIGWIEIWRSLPTHPLFYLLFLVLYFLLPVSEVWIYRITWSFPPWSSFSAFVKKRIYNKDVLGYSGEVYFFSWARKNVGLPEKRIAETIRDNNIISSAASTLVTVALLGVFLFAGEIRLSALIGPRWGYYLVGIVAVLAVLAPIAVRFRRYLFSMPVRMALIIFSIQVVRLVIGQGFQILQWEVVMPEVPLRIWFTFAAASIILTRIPLLPNQNLLFLGAGVEMSSMMDISTAGVAGMLLAVNVVDKLLNLTLFGLISVGEARNGPTIPKEE